MSLKASIDIGSNSTLLLIIDSESKKILREESRITSLGKNLDKTKKFADDSMENTFLVLQEYVRYCDDVGIKSIEIIASATEASRVAVNAKDFYERIKTELGLCVHLISGEGEAYYTAKGVALMSQLNEETIVIMDIGGASTELIKVTLNPFSIVESISLAIGSARVSDWKKEGCLEDNIEKVLSSTDLKPFEIENIICVAGTMTSISMMIQNVATFNAESVNSFSCTLNNFEKYIGKIAEMSLSEMDNSFPFLGKRLNTIRGGAYGAAKILRELKVETLKFSTFGLRYGTALSGGIDEHYTV